MLQIIALNSLKDSEYQLPNKAQLRNVSHSFQSKESIDLLSSAKQLYNKSPHHSQLTSTHHQIDISAAVKTNKKEKSTQDHIRAESYSPTYNLLQSQQSILLTIMTVPFPLCEDAGIGLLTNPILALGLACSFVGEKRA